MLYLQVEHHTASKTLSTALRDKATTYNRLRKAKPIAGSPGMHLASRTFKLWREPPNQNQGVYFT